MRIPLYALSGAVVFSGAFLLFAIQPMAGKQLLPLFGGASSVWATSLLFFTTALFIGYLYVYGLAKLPKRTQPLVHAGLIGLALLFTAASAISVQDVSVSFPWGERFPALGVLAALAVSIGIPYVLLASTGPLVSIGTARSPVKRHTPFMRFPTPRPYSRSSRTRSSSSQ